MYSTLALGAAIIPHSSFRTHALHPLNAALWIMRAGHEPSCSHVQGQVAGSDHPQEMSAPEEENISQSQRDTLA